MTDKMVDGNNKTPTEMHTFLPVENSKDEILTSKYKVQVILKDPEAAATLTDNKNFNPFTERKNDNPTTDCDTLTHLLKASLGTGILSMPCAFRSAGLIVGVFGTMLISLICTHCSYILVKCAHVLYHRTATTKMSFADVAESAFATGPKWCRGFSKASRYFVQVSLFLTYFGTCSAYTVIIAANFKEVIDYYLSKSRRNAEVVIAMLNSINNSSLETSGLTNNLTLSAGNATSTIISNLALNATNATSILMSTLPLNATNVTSAFISNLAVNTVNATDILNKTVPTVDVRIIIAFLLLPLILLTWLPNLKYLAPASMAANVFMSVGLAITFYYLIRDSQPIAEIPLAVEFDKLPTFFSLTIFAMEAIGVIMPLENNMRTPQNFVGICGVLNKGMSGVTVIYILLGFLGFVAYPGSNKDLITMDLVIQEIPAQVVKVLIGLGVFLTFGLQFYVCLDIVWSSLKDKFQKRPRLYEYIIRTVMVIACVILAILVPTISPFVGLIGAFCFSILGILAPILLETIIYWDIGFGYCKWIVIKNIALALVGFFALIFGTSQAINGIIEVYTDPKNQH